ncbi:acyl-ACP--UDP-N-acetylglucosamine O-acyltransferase [Pigmentiphaga aceris]|uniref:Acyl-[acyl-carrier-protein]--UDP-N-acetylglucosamine O-acyltransferase n=1 Tax=Pigmentiphaga aceris TaxID=1940612 RepID=A0A5C0AZI6_9BURK|nr:acyl-ACP--UDP-N-acetylglucosamine O-acyltransferase [Pigmentiphaga aceris]QEI06270.1 acyl-ACP--UDP-N-acetylglucosamine O-acyltransferase [Pigmentiphaga aceris]
MTRIHPTAIVDPAAQLDSSVTVGAYTLIGPNVRIDAGTTIGPHCVFDGHTTIGRDNQFFQFSSIGAVPQDKKYRNEPTQLIIGDRNVIREFATFHVGTAQDDGITRLGDDNWIMSYVHLAHDCKVGNNTIFANNAALAGHVKVGDYVILGGFTTVHQFVQIGAHAMTAMASALLQDLPPYVTVAGNVARPYGINVEGLKRRGFSSEEIAALRAAFKHLYREGHSLADARAAIIERQATQPAAAGVLQTMLDFLDSASRGIVR